MRFRCVWPARNMVILAGMACYFSVLASGPVAAWQDAKQPTEDQPAEKQSPRTIEEVLAARVNLDFVDTPLPEILETIAGQYGIPVVMDKGALADGGVDESSPLTFSMQGTRLDTMLHLLLRPLELTYTEHRGVLLITTSSAADELRLVRPYVVTDLLGKAPDGELDFDSLIGVITSTVRPDSWDENGGSGSIIEYLPGGTLVIGNSWHVHLKVEKLLAALRAEREQPGSSVTAEKRALRDKFAGTVTLEFNDTPLGEVLETLAATEEVNFYVDNAALADAGIDEQSTVTFAAQGLRLGDALELFLRVHDLTTCTFDDVLIVTTSSHLEDWATERVYGAGELGSAGAAVAPHAGDMESLIETITTTVTPESWDENGGAGTVAGMPHLGLLVVHQPSSVQSQVEELIGQLASVERLPEALTNPPETPDENGMVLKLYPLGIMPETVGMGAPQPAAGEHSSSPATLMNTGGTAQDLAKIVSTTIAAETWEGPVGKAPMIQTLPRLLIVRHKPEVQAEIGALLKKLGVLAPATDSKGFPVGGIGGGFY